MVKRESQSVVCRALCLLLLFVAGTLGGLTREYANCRIVSAAQDVRLLWNITGNTIKVGFYGNLAGYLAIAPSDDGTMSGSPRGFCDNWITNKQGVVQDSYFSGKDQPVPDGRNDFSWTAFSLSGGYLYAEFDRLLNTGDVNNDYAITPGTAQTLIWAGYPTYRGGEYRYHGTVYMGSVLVDFGKPSSCDAATAGQFLSPTGFTVLWTLDDAKTTINFTMSFPTTGWISIALNSVGLMAGADMYSGWVVGGSLTLYDGYCSGRTVPSVDASSSILPGSSGSIVNGITSINFSRLLNTGDAAEDYTITSGTAALMVAWGANGVTGTPGNFPVHQSHDTAFVNFLNTGNGSSVLPPTKPPSNGAGNTWVDSAGRYYISWKVNKTSSLITFNMTVKALGWVSLAFGAGPATTMLGLDVVVGWLDANGVVYVRDCIADSTSKIQPVPDTTENIVSMSGSKNGAYTTIIFSRYLDTGDQTQDYAIRDASLLLAIAWADTIPSAFKRDAQVLTYTVHTAWDATNINLLSTAAAPSGGGIVVTGTVDATKPKGNNIYSVGSFYLSYEVSADGTEVTFLMSAPTLGWISIGLNPTNNKMAVSDTYTGWVSNGQVFFYDEQCTSYSQPTKDSSQDATVLAAEEVNGKTSIVFKRKLNTGDSNDVPLMSTAFIIWASSPNDGSSTGNYGQHNLDGSKAVDFGLQNAFAAIDPIKPLESGHIVLLVAGLIMIIWALIRLVSVLYKRSHYTTYSSDPPAASYTDVYELYEQVGDQEMQEKKIQEAPEGDDPINSPQQPVGMELHAGRYEGNTYVKLSPEERAGGLNLKHDSKVTAFFKGVFENRFHGSHITLGDVIVFSLYIGLNVAAFFITKANNSFILNGAAANLGSLVGGNCVIVVMFATRHSALVYLLGIPFDRAILFHRWLGRWNTILVLGHVIIEAYLYFTVGNGNTDAENIYGLVSFISFLLVLIFSLEWFRRNQFELFMVSHLLVIAFFVLGVLHNKGFLLYTILSAILLALDWLLRLVLGSLVVPSKTTLFKKRAENLVQVRFNKNAPWAKKLYGPGQYVFINFPSISHTEWHPFSVTSSPDEPEIEVNIRALGNWTKKVEKLASTENRVWVRADGPYGNLNLDYHRYSHVVLIAGGIGITPIIGILKEIFAGKKRRSRIQSVLMVWSVPSEGESGWFMDEMKYLYQISNSSSIKLEIKIHLSRAKEVPPGLFLNSGRPDLDKYLDGATQERAPCFVFVCGPKKLVNSAWDTSTKLQRKGKICHFHHETFEF